MQKISFVKIGLALSVLFVSGGRCTEGTNLVSTANGFIGTSVVHAVEWSHMDLGYANYPHILRTENRLENVFRAVHYADQTADWPDASKYRYQVEIAEHIPFFLSQCSLVERESLARYIKEDRIAVAATHATVLTDRLTPESASRLFYLRNRHMPDLLGVPPSKVGMINDVIGLSWCLPIYCQAAGVPYFSFGHNSCAGMRELESTPFAPLVRWQGPGGTGEVLVYSKSYGAIKGGLKAIAEGAAIKAGAESTQYNIPAWFIGADFTPSTLELATIAKEWNATGQQPEIRISTAELYFDALAKRQTAEKMPTVNKHGTCQWMDQPISDAWLFGRVREAAERLPMAEKFSSVALATTKSAYPWFDLTTGWHNLLSHFEHTYGMAAWRGVKPGGVEGCRHYETERIEHREIGLQAYDRANHSLDDALSRLAGNIAATGENNVAVFNPLAQPRTDPVSFEAPESMQGQSLAAMDRATGQKYPCQWRDKNTLFFIAHDVPAFGYRVFQLVPQPEAEKAEAGTDNVVDSRHYWIKMDRATGTIAALWDKELDKDLVDRQSRDGFNQYLYEWYPNPDINLKSSWSRPPVAESVTLINGPAAAVIHVRAKAEGVNWLEQTITVYHDIKRIDFELRMDKRPSGRSIQDYADQNLRGKESVFVALPFNIPGFKAVYQTPGGGVAEPVRDYFEGVGTAFQAVQHFTDLSNDSMGITVSPLDCALVEFGHPRSDALSRKNPEFGETDRGEMRFEKMRKNTKYPDTSSLYLYLMDNMFTVNLNVDQRGEHRFRWALRSHTGDWKKSKADQFGESVNQPLQARMIPATTVVTAPALPGDWASFGWVDADNVSISTCKQAEYNGDGFVVRVVETRGQKTRCKLSLPFLAPIESIRETNLVETDLAGRPLAVVNDIIEVELPPYGVRTFRVQRAGAKAVAQVAGLSAQPLSDQEVALSWTPADDAAFYRVYRDTQPDFKPSALTLVATPQAAAYKDQARDHIQAWIINRLAPETAYYYRVEAVNRFNQRGPVSEAVAVKTFTTAQKACPPQAVRDLHAILVSPLSPYNQVNLLWRSNVEPNITAYEIHRSTAAGFIPSQKTRLLTQPVKIFKQRNYPNNSFYAHQMYLDATVDKATTYYYRVCAVTSTGLMGEFSDEACVQTAVTDEPVVGVKTTPPADLMMGLDGKVE